ncbi:hypothetical protein ACWDR0_15790 [Streptomyces sp. NPDC003691]
MPRLVVVVVVADGVLAVPVRPGDVEAPDRFAVRVGESEPDQVVGGQE